MKKMGRRAFIARAVALTCAGTLFPRQTASAAEALDPDILKAQLCAKTELECAFVDDVVDKAKDGTLPIKILTTAYRYALSKGRSSRLIYFKRCLEELTKRAGLKITFKNF
ncbi:MAG: hypothetical protein J6X44_06325 [Thermoguttaceae bacterium]|nr:hypothetical protein [Thermoguttaceae bacterium]